LPANPNQRTAKGRGHRGLFARRYAIRNNIQQRESFDQAMDFFHVEDAALRRDVWNSSKEPWLTGTAADNAADLERPGPKPQVAERRLLELLIHDREMRNLILPQLESSDYKDLAYRRDLCLPSSPSTRVMT
jgi:hypothetical protein